MAHRATQGHTPEATEGGVTDDAACEPAAPVDAPAGRETVSDWNIANALTMGRIALVPFFGWFLVARGGHDDTFRIIAFVLFAVAAITDRIDGDIARKRGLVTDFGKLMDPIADKALTGMAFVGLSLINVVPWWATVLILAREIAVTALRFVVIRRSHGVMPASRGGKIKTALQALAAGLFVLPLPWVGHALAWAILAGAIVVTVVTGVDYFVQAARLNRRHGGRGTEGSA